MLKLLLQQKPDFMGLLLGQPSFIVAGLFKAKMDSVLYSSPLLTRKRKIRLKENISTTTLFFSSQGGQNTGKA